MKFAKKLSDQYTRCPHCSTLYALFHKITLDNLATVSCGTCQNTFIAKDHLTLPKKKVVIPDQNNPYHARLSQTTGAEPSVSAEQKVKKQNTWRWVTAGLGIFLGVNLGIGAYFWLIGSSMLENPLVRSGLTAFCGVFHCNPADYYNPQNFQVVQHELVPNPADTAQLQLQILIKNTSIFPQPLATVQIEIQDLAGKTLKTLTFAPSEYAPANPSQLVDSEKDLPITLDLNQTTPDLFSYKINFI